MELTDEESQIIHNTKSYSGLDIGTEMVDKLIMSKSLRKRAEMNEQHLETRLKILKEEEYKVFSRRCRC